MDWTRRDFGRLAGASLATQLLASSPARLLRAQVAQPETEKRFNYCIVGLGRISMNEFMPGTLRSRRTQVTALVSGHPDKAARVAKQYDVAEDSVYSYENFDRIADNKNIDAVYIALPNSMHAEYSIRAARAGKHVLCEKPMASTVDEARSMIDACRKANVKLMIAYRLHYEPTNLAAIQLLREGKLGTLNSIESSFGFNCGPTEWRLNRKLAGGGPLMDVGIYCLNACRYLTGEEPQDIQAYAAAVDKDDPRFSQVEETLFWTMRFPSGVLANCGTTYGSYMNGYFRVHGSKGYMHVDPAYNYDGMKGEVHFSDGRTIEELNGERDPAQFTAEGDHLAECVARNKEPKTPGEEGLRDMELIKRIYQAAGIHY